MQQNTNDRAFAEVRRVLRFLLLGVDPETNEPLIEASLSVGTEVREALVLGIEEMKGSPWVRRWQAGKRAGGQLSWRARQASGPGGTKGAAAERTGVGWSLQEDMQIAQEYAEGQNLTMMATNHQRSRGSVLARLVHLGLKSNKAKG